MEIQGILGETGNTVSICPARPLNFRGHGASNTPLEAVVMTQVSYYQQLPDFSPFSLWLIQGFFTLPASASCLFSEHLH